MIKLLDLQKLTAAHLEEYEEALHRVMARGWFLQGEELARFETDYARYIGTKHCVGVANGLDALRLIIMGYKELGKFSEGDEIIVPANTYIATILAISECGLQPVLVEPRWETLELDTALVEQYITSRTRGIMTVHLYGRIAYDERLKDISRKYNLKLMEDCAQSHGCSWHGTKTGALSDAAAHSFYPGKNLGAMGDAGAVTTDDEDLAKVIRALGNYGSEKKYVFRYKGINSRMSEFDAAILTTKLKYLDEENNHRRAVAAFYYNTLHNPQILLPYKLPDENNVYHQFPILCERRDKLQEYLRQNEIQTLIHYPIPPHKQTCYRNWNNRSYPITERIHACELSIPVHPALTDAEAETIVNVMNKFH